MEERIAKLLYFDFQDYEEGTIAEVSWRDAPQARKDVWLNKSRQILQELSKGMMGDEEIARIY